MMHGRGQAPLARHGRDFGGDGGDGDFAGDADFSGAGDPGQKSDNKCRDMFHIAGIEWKSFITKIVP